jgi:hypothetical protein
MGQLLQCKSRRELFAMSKVKRNGSDLHSAATRILHGEERARLDVERFEQHGAFERCIIPAPAVDFLMTDLLQPIGTSMSCVFFYLRGVA